MAKRSIRRSQIVNSSQSTDHRHPAPDATRSDAVPPPLPEDIATDPGYLALRLTGLSDLVRGAAAEDQLSPEAGFFVAATMDDIAGRLSR
jgi:hypothetical protein